jgi:hypothetical protein
MKCVVRFYGLHQTFPTLSNNAVPPCLLDRDSKTHPPEYQSEGLLFNCTEVAFVLLDTPYKCRDNGA